MNGFLTELLTQGDVLRQVAGFYRQDGKKMIEAIAEEYRAKGMNKLIMTGMGSSLSAMEAMRSYFTQHGVPCITYSSHELENYQFEQITPRTMVIAISASGGSQEVLRLVEKARSITTVVGITNKEESKLAELCDLPLYIKAGPEISITSKTYEVTMMLLNILGRYITGTYDAQFEEDLDRTIDWICAWCRDWERPSEDMAAFADGVTCFDLLANDSSRAASRQVALAYREGLHNATSEWELAEYAHGQYHSSKQQEKYLAQIFNPVLEEGTKDLKMFNFILDHGGKVMVYSPHEVPDMPNVYAVKTPDVPASLLPLAEAVAAESMLGVLFGEDWVKDH